MKNKIPDNLIPLYHWWEDGSKGNVIVAFDPERHEIKNFYFDSFDDELPYLITSEKRYYHHLNKLPSKV
ncbi:MAG: hypothetical protein [Podoviridae sp. ctviO18]|nr:MAG: hypothetical protein [Podoviridae sp. ctviO18]